MRTLIFFISLFCLGFVQAQKTYYIQTERESQDVFIDGTKWDKEPFFTVDPSNGYHQVIVKEKGYINQFDLLREGIHAVYSTQQRMGVDTTILAIVKPIELKYAEDIEITTYDVDYVGYMKDITYVGEISKIYGVSPNKDMILSSISPQNQYLINELNDYHSLTRGRYKFYSLGTIKSIDVFEVTMDKDTKFIQAEVKVDWSITAKLTDNLPEFNFEGTSGKFMYDPESKSQASSVNAAIHDALFSSLINFLADQEIKIKRSM